MEESADGLGFIGAVLKRDRRYTKDVCDIRNPRFFAGLVTMCLRRINQCILKIGRKLHTN